jgi:hypothetical protein
MGLLDIFLPDQSYNAKRALVKRWLLKVEAPDFDNLEELPFEGPDLSDTGSESDQQDTESEPEQTSIFPRPFSIVMTDFDFSKYQVAYSTWQDPFAQQPSSPTGFQYSKAPVRSGGDGQYRRPLVPVKTSLFHHPGVVEESPSESSDNEGKGLLSHLPHLKTYVDIAETVASSSGANATASTVASRAPAFAEFDLGPPPPPPPPPPAAAGPVSITLRSSVGQPLTSPAVPSRTLRSRWISVVAFIIATGFSGRIRWKGQEIKV